ncbi:MAG: hypothetical protein J7L08_02930, partial [Candidatus Aenigmarchaeota archaeon]|nr:hypothetical protein [Candidatus Aenigmarchaeota archaeon]
MKRFLIVLIFLFLVPMVHAEIFEADELYFFVSPDSALQEISSLINQSNESIYIATYSFDNSMIARQLNNRSKKGIDVKIMVEGSPVGGLDKDSLFLMSNCTTIYLNKDNRYHYHHAKYAIFDNRTVLVSTENFNDRNRGWFAVIKDKEIADYFLNLFFNDLKNSEIYDNIYSEPKESSNYNEEMNYTPVFGKGYCYNSSVEI